jgi:hypothetical protein
LRCIKRASISIEFLDLKVEMSAPLRLARHAILTYQHEDGQKHAFGRDKKRQNAEGERIESSYAGNQVEIRGDPTRDYNHVQKKKFGAADKSYDGITLAFRALTPIQSFFFQLGDGGNIELRGIFRNLIRYRFFYELRLLRECRSRTGPDGR